MTTIDLKKIPKKLNILVRNKKVTEYLYVLKALSQNKNIKLIPDLCKNLLITKSVKQRIANIPKQSTYLNIDVRLVLEKAIILRFKKLNILSINF